MVTKRTAQNNAEKSQRPSVKDLEEVTSPKDSVTSVARRISEKLPKAASAEPEKTKPASSKNREEGASKQKSIPPKKKSAKKDPAREEASDHPQKKKAARKDPVREDTQGIPKKTAKKKEPAQEQAPKRNRNDEEIADKQVKHRKKVSLAKVILSSRPLVIGIAVICALCILFGADAVANWGKIFPGVKVGVIDVGGLTVEEATARIDEAYTQHVTNGQVTIYGFDGEAEPVSVQTAAMAQVDDAAGVSDRHESAPSWTISASELETSVPAASMAEDAMQLGRANGGPLQRVGILLFGGTIEPYATFNEGAIEWLGNQVDDTCGSRMENFNVGIEDGKGYITNGHDGNQVNRAELKKRLNSVLFDISEDADTTFDIETHTRPVGITQERAQELADTITNALADGVVFRYEDLAWQATPTMVGNCLRVSTEEVDGIYTIGTYVDIPSAKHMLTSQITTFAGEVNHTITFEKTDDGLLVHTNQTGTMPLVGEAANAMWEALFGANRQEGAAAADGIAPDVTINVKDIPESLTFEEAIDAGFIVQLSTYTTKYSNDPGTEERSHNIHLMADLLNNSIATANGGKWSFHDTGGPSDTDHGFQAAGAIENGVLVDSVGGGICQVATTVYNAVFEAGLPITTRFCHTMYVASYPDGRDAAVSYPDMDLIWKNDTESDVALLLSYTDTSITASLYSAPTGRSIKTIVGDWEDGAKYDTLYIPVNWLGENETSVRTYGIDGRKIRVYRNVYDKDGRILDENVIDSCYDPEYEVLYVGPGSTRDKAQAQGKLISIEEAESMHL